METTEDYNAILEDQSDVRRTWTNTKNLKKMIWFLFSP